MSAPELLWPAIDAEASRGAAAAALVRAGFPIAALFRRTVTGRCTCPLAGGCKTPGAHPPQPLDGSEPAAQAFFRANEGALLALRLGDEPRLLALVVEGIEGRAQLDAFDLATAEARSSDGARLCLFLAPPGLDLAVLGSRPGLSVHIGGPLPLVGSQRWAWTRRGPVAALPEALARLLGAPAPQGEGGARGRGAPPTVDASAPSSSTAPASTPEADLATPPPAAESSAPVEPPAAPPAAEPSSTTPPAPEASSSAAPPAPVLLPVLPSKNLRAWPGNEQGGAIAYRPAAEAFRQRYATDAHFAGYDARSVRRRLDKGAPGHPVDGAPLVVPMVLLTFDVDGANHQADPAWRERERAKVARALAAHPGGFAFETRNGYRLVWRRAAPFPIASSDDAARWRVFYWRAALYLSRVFGIEPDPACADWTRIFRLPHATRPNPDGSPGDGPEELPTEGDPELLTPWAFEPAEADLAADLAEARRLLEQHPAAKNDDGKTKVAAPWSAAVKALALAAGEADEAPSSPAPEAPRAPRHTPRPGRPSLEERERLWCEKALDRMSSDVARAGQGTRNAVARDAGLILGHYAPRYLNPSAIEAALVRACEANGLIRDDGRDAALATIRKAISDGMREPKRPELPPDDPRDDHQERMRDAFARARAKQGRTTDRDTKPENEMHDQANHDQADEQQGPASGPRAAAGGQGRDWRADLQRDRTGYRKNLANVALILSHDRGWAECLAYDEFSDRIALLHCPPSHAHLASERFPRDWRDADDVHTARWLQTEWGIEAGPDLVGQAIVAVGHERRIHPVRDYLDGLTWDGTPRLERWLTAYLGVRETIYSHTVGPMMLRAAVARVLFPGCKVDTMLVFQGLQDQGKSTAIKVLCGEEWFTDELADFGSKDAAMQLLGVWLIEVAELAGMGRAEIERTKGFLSRTTDRYRPAYGRHVRKQPRQCVFFGTTNADTYLKDETGNRRFWPVLCGAVGGIDLEGIRRDRDQLWAEATAQVNAGMRWHLDKVKDAEAMKQAKAAQGAVQERDAWENVVASYLADKDRVFIETIFTEALGLKVERWGRPEQMRVAAILKRAGWTRHRLTTEAGGRMWGYLAPYAQPDAEDHVPTSPGD